ncbi:hypothetical protein J6Q66_07440 [bacterium]|nr:hypothetical protein [bacterium]
MICPKCKSEISDTALRCPICNAKVKMFCPACHALVRFGVASCNFCHHEILKKCKNCGAVNLASESICRKCKKPVKILMVDATKPKVQEIQDTQPEQQIETKTQENQVQELARNGNPKVEQSVDTVIKIEEEQLETKILPEETEEKININPAEIFEINISEGVDISSVDSGISKEDDKKLNVKYYEQPEAQDRLFTAIKGDKKQILAISGQAGFGKTTVLKQVISMLSNDKINVLFCECSANTQLSPFGAIQFALRNYLSLPDFYANEEIFEKSFKPVICSAFHFLSKTEQNYIANFLYPTEQSFYENILENQTNTYEILNKIINYIQDFSQLVLVVDSFDFIDAASYKYLSSLIKSGVINNRVKLLVAYRENVHIQSYLNFINEDESIYENIFLKNLSENNFNELVKFFLNGSNPLTDGLKKQIVKNSDLNAGYIEQAIFHMNDLNSFVVENGSVILAVDAYDINLPETFEKLVATRLSNLKISLSHHYEFLLIASLLGNVFNAQIVQSIMNLPDDATNNVINYLINAGYIVPYMNTDFSFKNGLVWQNIYDAAKNDEKFNDYNKKIHMLLSTLEFYNLPIKALFAQNIDENFIAFNLWTQNIKIASAVGDIDLYVLSQKQCLKLLNEFTHTNSEYIKNNIHERIGKLTYKSNPIEATEFLTDAMAVYHKSGDTIKAIELSGFLLKAQKLEDNANAIIEIVDNVLKLLPNTGYILERALINSKKLSALLKIGNYDELINIVRNEIIPVLESGLARPVAHKRYSHEFLFKTWVNCAICEANAYSYQGNDRGLEVIAAIEDVLKANDKLNFNECNSKIEISKALAYSNKGQLDFSDEILKNINLSDEFLTSKDISNINLIKVINKLLRYDFVNIRDELFEYATFANNCNDVVLKNIFKALLAKLIKDDGNAQKALDIYNEQVTYFAGEKISAGAFLCWYFMAEIYLLTDGPDKALEIAMKSLEITKSPKISNYNFMIMFKKFIAEIYLIKRDFEAAKMYIEKALMMARKYGLDYQIMTLYHLYGKYFEELVTSKTSEDILNAQNAMKMFDKSNDIAQELNIEKYTVNNDNAKQSLQVYCQLNNIAID